MAEGARLESVFRGNSNVGSNPTLSAMLLKINKLTELLNPLSEPLSSLESVTCSFAGPKCDPLRQKQTDRE